MSTTENNLPKMKGFFAIGIDGATKGGNVGNLIRTGHSFGAAFCFAIDPRFRQGKELDAFSDTSRTDQNIPYYEYGTINELVLPKGCQLVAIELTEDAIAMPSFRHPRMAAYVLGSERLSVSDDILAQADYIVKIPTRFSLNVATAGAIVMYDRMLNMGRFAERPLSAGGPVSDLPEHVRGGPIFRQGRPGPRPTHNEDE